MPLVQSRCLACGIYYFIPDEDNSCPNRYLSPHGDGFLRLVKNQLRRMCRSLNPTIKEHHKAIELARIEYDKMMLRGKMERDSDGYKIHRHYEAGGDHN